MSPDYESLQQQLDAVRNAQLRRLAQQDETLTLLRQALEQERAIRAMTPDALLAFLIDLQARWERKGLDTL